MRKLPHTHTHTHTPLRATRPVLCVGDSTVKTVGWHESPGFRGRGMKFSLWEGDITDISC